MMGIDNVSFHKKFFQPRVWQLEVASSNDFSSNTTHFKIASTKVKSVFGQLSTFTGGKIDSNDGSISVSTIDIDFKIKAYQVEKQIVVIEFTRKDGSEIQFRIQFLKCAEHLGIQILDFDPEKNALELGKMKQKQEMITAFIGGRSEDDSKAAGASPKLLIVT